MTVFHATPSTGLLSLLRSHAGVLDHFLSLQDAADQKADDGDDDGQLDEREAFAGWVPELSANTWTRMAVPPCCVWHTASRSGALLAARELNTIL
jgi:hypothetical protein